MPRVVDPYSSFRSCSDGIGRFQFVHDLKIASHYGDLENISRLTGVKGCHWLSLRAVRTDGIERFQSVVRAEN